MQGDGRSGYELLSMLNPIHQSAGWMHPMTLESLLGFHKQGDNLALDPCIPRGWPSFEITFRYRTARYEITVENPLGVCRGVLAIRLDDKMLTRESQFLVPLVYDGAPHRARVVLGST